MSDAAFFFLPIAAFEFIEEVYFPNRNVLCNRPL
jgi:hypothetical protein